jgi:hypothetical protein
VRIQTWSIRSTDNIWKSNKTGLREQKPVGVGLTISLVTRAKFS